MRSNVSVVVLRLEKKGRRVRSLLWEGDFRIALTPLRFLGVTTLLGTPVVELEPMLREVAMILGLWRTGFVRVYMAGLDGCGVLLATCRYPESKGLLFFMLIE